jgi:hypothetical protein
MRTFQHFRSVIVVSVVGLVVVWGETWLDEFGARAPDGEVVALALGPNQPADELAVAEVAARRLGVSCVNWRDLAEHARQRRVRPLPEAPVPAPLQLPRDESAPPPTFRFRFAPTAGHVRHGGFCPVWPDEGASVLPEAPFAVGDIVALDDDRAVASFAYYSDGVRSLAEDHLSRWAEDDDWRLEIAPELRPLGPTLRTNKVFACTRCDDRSFLAYFAVDGYLKAPFHRTRCRKCRHGRHLPQPDSAHAG